MDDRKKVSSFRKYAVTRPFFVMQNVFLRKHGRARFQLAAINNLQHEDSFLVPDEELRVKTCAKML